MAKQNNADPNVTLAILVVGVLVLYFVAITIPVPFVEKKDAYIDFSVQKELIGTPKLVQVSARVQPATLMESPEFLGAIFGLQAGDVSVSAETPSGISKIIKMGDVTSGFDVKKRIVLKDLPVNETQITLTLYEGKDVRETKVIEI